MDEIIRELKQSLQAGSALPSLRRSLELVLSSGSSAEFVQALLTSLAPKEVSKAPREEPTESASVELRTNKKRTRKSVKTYKSKRRASIYSPIKPLRSSVRFSSSSPSPIEPAQGAPVSFPSTSSSSSTSLAINSLLKRKAEEVDIAKKRCSSSREKITRSVVIDPELLESLRRKFESVDQVELSVEDSLAERESMNEKKERDSTREKTKKGNPVKLYLLG